MKKNILKNKKNSVFSKTFLTLSLSIMTVLGIVFLSFYGLFSHSYEEHIYSANLDMVKKTGSYVDLILSSIHYDTDLLGFSADVINAAIVPTTEESTRNYRIVEQLKEMSGRNEYVDDIRIYIPVNGLSFSAKEGVRIIDSFKGQTAILNDDLPDIKLISAKEDEEQLLLYYNDFTKDATWRIGQTIAYLNYDRLIGTIKGQTENRDGEFSILDKKMRVLLGESEYVKSFIQKFSAEPKALDGYIIAGKRMFFFSTSADSGLTYVYSAPYGILSENRSYLLLIFGLTSICCVLLTLIMSVLITKSIYRPLSTLVEAINGGPRTDSVTGERRLNEYDFISHAYSNAVSQEVKLKDMLENIAPIVSERMLSVIISGHTISQAEYEYYEKYIDMERFEKSLYSVISLQFDLSTISSSDFSIMEDIRNLRNSFEIYSYLSPDQQQLLLICVFSQNEPIRKIKAAFSNYSQQVESMLQKYLGIEIFAGSGNIYKGFDGLIASNNEANEAMKYAIYISSPQLIDIANVKKDDVNSTNHHNYYDTISRKLISAVTIGDEGSAIGHLATLSTALKNDERQSISLSKHIYMSLIDELNTSFIILELPQDDVQSIRNAYMEIEVMNSYEDIASYMERIVLDATQIIRKRNDSKQHKAVLLAQEYIQEHYTDSNMSLNNVAEYVEISSAYLSRLFKNECKSSFTDYVNMLRVNKAKELLDNTKITVTEAGFAVGFNTIHNFIRLFKKYEGITPGQYNENLGKK